MKLIPAKDWGAPPGGCSYENFVKSVQSNALSHTAEVIQTAVDEGVPIDSAIALVRIKAGNLDPMNQTTTSK